MRDIIIDIREPFEYKMGHINNAINIPKDILLLAPDRYLNKYNNYVLYCSKGIFSKEVSLKLNSIGYKTTSLDGGYEMFKNSNSRYY